MKEFKQLAGQTLIYGLGTMVPRLLNYVILTPYFTRNLFEHATAEYGKVTELYAYITFLMIILTYGMETTYFRFVNKEKDGTKVFSTIFTCLLITSVVFLVCILLFSTSIAGGLRYTGESFFISLLAGILAVEALSAIPFAKLRIENRPGRFALLKFIQIAVNIGLMLGIYNIMPVVTGSNSYLLNDAGTVSSRFIFIANLVASSIVLIFLLPELKDYKFYKFDFKLVKPLFLYGLPLMISGLAGTINETLDRSIYKHVIEDKDKALQELGIYGANYKIGGLILIFIQMFRYAAEPYFFNKEKDKDSKEQYANLMNIFVGVVVAMGCFILLFIDYIKVFIGSSYHEGLFVVPYIVLAYILYGILFNLSIWYKLSNKTQYAFIIMVVGALITIGINIFYIPVYGYHASAVAHVISYGTMVILSYWLGRRYYRINYNVGKIGLYLFLGFLMFVGFRELRIEVEFIDIIFRAVVLLLFVTFVAWNENIISNFRKNASKNS